MRRTKADKIKHLRGLLRYARRKRDTYADEFATWHDAVKRCRAALDDALTQIRPATAKENRDG